MLPVTDNRMNRTSAEASDCLGHRPYQTWQTCLAAIGCVPAPPVGVSGEGALREGSPSTKVARSAVDQRKSESNVQSRRKPSDKPDGFGSSGDWGALGVRYDVGPDGADALSGRRANKPQMTRD
jgi:hypothetical protein